MILNQVSFKKFEVQCGDLVGKANECEKQLVEMETECHVVVEENASEECWSLPEVSTNGVERNHSFAKVYLFFFMVGELKCRKSSSWIMGASATLYEVLGIPTKQEEEER